MSSPNCRRKIFFLGVTLAAAIGTLSDFGLRCAQAQATKATKAQRVPSSTRIPAQTDGEYLARAGDCVSCHTARGGEPFAGGLEMKTPFGTLYTPNITPDPETGIGKWSADDFWRALHDGRSRDGSLLYPAFPPELHQSHACRRGRDLWIHLVIEAGAQAQYASRHAVSL